MTVGPSQFISDVDKHIIASYTSKNKLILYIKNHSKCEFKYSVVNQFLKVLIRFIMADSYSRELTCIEATNTI